MKPTTYRYLPPHLADRLDQLAIELRAPVSGAGQGLHRSRFHGSSVEFADYREYAPGDAPNRIDWALYARSDRYLVRRFEDETRLRAHVLVDTSESMGYRCAGPHTKLDHARYLAAGLMYALVKQGDNVCVHGFAQDVADDFTPASGLEGLRPMLLGIEGWKAAGSGAVDGALHAFADSGRRRGLAIVVSDFLQEPGKLMSAVRHLRHAGHQVSFLHVLDRAELALPFAGVVEIAELESGQKAVVDVDDFRAAYAREVRRHVDTLRRGCADAGAGYFLAETSQPVDAALRAWVGTL